MWILYAFASAFFAGVTAVLAKLGMEGVNSHLATALRTIVVALFGWAMVWVAGSSGAVGALEPRSWLFLILSGLATGGSWLCYFRALQLGEVNQVAPVDKSSTVLTMLLSILLLGEAAHWNTLLGMGLILAGTLGMLQRKPRERASSGWGWLPWAVLSAVCASLTSILGKVGMTGVDSYVGTAIRNMVVLAMAWALVLGLGLQREIPTLSRKNWGFLAVSGVSTGLSWMFYYRALQEGPASVVAPIDKLSILVTVGFSCLVLCERLSRRAAAGLLVLTCGTLLLLL